MHKISDLSWLKIQKKITIYFLEAVSHLLIDCNIYFKHLNSNIAPATPPQAYAFKCRALGLKTLFLPCFDNVT